MKTGLPVNGLLVLASITGALLGGWMIFSLMAPYVESIPVEYSGKELFTTKQYEDFKLVLGNSKVDILEIVVLSSNPILVQFVVDVPIDLEFPYGVVSWAVDKPLVYALGTFLVIILAGLPLLGWRTGKRDYLWR